MLDKDGSSRASCFSKTKQVRENNCRRTETLEEQVTGDFYDDDHQYNTTRHKCMRLYFLQTALFAGKIIL
jgi:hypothetical protein